MQKTNNVNMLEHQCRNIGNTCMTNVSELINMEKHMRHISEIQFALAEHNPKRDLFFTV